MRRLVLVLLLCSFAAPRVSANAPEDMFGLSARTNAMGGAATALSRDGFAAYHNPASLARCPDNQINVDVRHARYGLSTERLGADAPPDSVAPLRDPTRFALGACLLLPFHLAAGFTVGIGLEDPGTLRLDTSSSRPVFPLYGESLEYLNINAALAYRPVRQFAIGAGASILLNSDLAISAFVPVGQLDPNGNFQDIKFNIGFSMAPRAAPYIGVLVEPHRRVRFALAFRGKLAHSISLPMSITAVFLDWTVPVPMQLTAETWYSPRQLSLGVSAEPIDALTLSSDVTWYGYNDLRESSFPYLSVSDIPGSMGSILGLVGIPTPDPPDYRSAWALRVGAEGRLLEGKLALRGGYAVRSSALPSPGARNTTLLDGTVHSFTLGAGYAFGVGWDDEQSGQHTFSEHHDDDIEVLDDAPVLEGDEGGETAEPARSASATPAPVESEDEPLRMSVRGDTFMRLSVMPDRTDSQKDLRWGGNIFDLGLTMTLGWR